MKSKTKPESGKGKGGKPQDWSEVLRGATPEAVARALLQPRKPVKPRPK